MACLDCYYNHLKYLNQSIWYFIQPAKEDTTLEPVCCKFLTSYWFLEQGSSEDSEWYKIDPRWSVESLGLLYNQFGIIQVLRRVPIPQTSNWSGTFFAVSYSKPALVTYFIRHFLISQNNCLFISSKQSDISVKKHCVIEQNITFVG